MFPFGGRLQYLTGTKTWLIIYVLRSVSKAAMFFSSVSRVWLSRWLFLELESSCAASLSERLGKEKFFVPVYILDDAKLPVISMKFVHKPFIIRLASACSDNVLRQNTRYAEEAGDLAGVLVETGCVPTEFESVSMSPLKSAVMTGSLETRFAQLLGP